MTDEYDSMSRKELLFRVKDWRRVANDRAVEIRRLTVENDRLRTAAQRFVEARRAWHEAATKTVPPLEYQRAYDDTMIELIDTVEALDEAVPDFGTVEAEYERLRAVAEAARAFLVVRCQNTDAAQNVEVGLTSMVAATETAVDAIRSALATLDGSGPTAVKDAAREAVASFKNRVCPDCGNGDPYCDCPDSPWKYAFHREHDGG